MFVEKILPMMVDHTLGKPALDEYRLPLRTQKDRLPAWMWPREVQIGDRPASSVQLLEGIRGFMGRTEMPVLPANADPGVLVPLQAGALLHRAAQEP